jgi:hypothetical protein
LGSFYYRRGSVVGEYRSVVQGPRDVVEMVQVEMVQVEMVQVEMVQVEMVQVEMVQVEDSGSAQIV